MVISWNQPNSAEGSAGHLAKRAAQYVRMSTEHQKYSTDNQTLAIARYAEARDYEIVQTYADEGKSGLTLTGGLITTLSNLAVSSRKSSLKKSLW